MKTKTYEVDNLRDLIAAELDQSKNDKSIGHLNNDERDEVLLEVLLFGIKSLLLDDIGILLSKADVNPEYIMARYNYTKNELKEWKIK